MTGDRFWQQMPAEVATWLSSAVAGVVDRARERIGEGDRPERVRALAAVDVATVMAHAPNADGSAEQAVGVVMALLVEAVMQWAGSAAADAGGSAVVKVPGDGAAGHAGGVGDGGGDVGSQGG